MNTFHSHRETACRAPTGSAGGESHSHLHFQGNELLRSKPPQVQVLQTVAKPDDTGFLEGRLFYSTAYKGTERKDTTQVLHVRAAAVAAGPFAVMDQLLTSPERGSPSSQCFPRAADGGATLQILASPPVCTLPAQPHVQMLLQTHKKQTMEEKEGQDRVWLMHACIHTCTMYGGPKCTRLWGCNGEQDSSQVRRELTGCLGRWGTRQVVKTQ